MPRDIAPLIYYDEAEGLVLVRGSEGVSTDLPEPDPDPATVPSSRIAAISVYAREITNPNGTNGSW